MGQLGGVLVHVRQQRHQNAPSRRNSCGRAWRTGVPALSATRFCGLAPCAVDCALSSYHPWTQCSASCGGGTKSRIRTVVTAAEFGGNGCASLEETAACKTQICPLDCVVTEFGAWSACSASCGSGTQTRRRSVVNNATDGGAVCPTPLVESQSCNALCCPGSALLAGTGCQPCEAGRYQSVSGESSCNYCPAGKYTDAPGAKRCTECSKGTYGAGDDTSTSGHCVHCPAGKFQVYDGNTNCELCPSGKFSAGHPHDSSQCLSCIAGQWTNNQAGQHQCRDRATRARATAPSTRPPPKTRLFTSEVNQTSQVNIQVHASRGREPRQ